MLLFEVRFFSIATRSGHVWRQQQVMWFPANCNSIQLAHPPNPVKRVSPECIVSTHYLVHRGKTERSTIVSEWKRKPR